MAYRRKTKRRYSSAPAKTKRRTYKTRTKRTRRASPRAQKITIVLQQAPMGMQPAGLTLGKKNYMPVRAKY